MQISKFNEYLVTTNTNNILKAVVVMGDELGNTFNEERVVEVEIVHSYEIYTKCPKTGTTGWDIKLVRSTDKLIKKYPHFDCIITKNDTHPEEDYLNPEEYYTVKHYYYN